MNQMPDGGWPAGLLDREVLGALLDDFDEETCRLLLATAKSDIARLGDDLIAACHAGDDAACQQARHSLKGVCANFGTDALFALCEGDLSSEAARNALGQCKDATIAALRQVTPD